jgi:hypothetical protein
MILTAGARATTRARVHDLSLEANTYLKTADEMNSNGCAESSRELRA